MSSYYIRKQAEVWARAITSVPYFPTINENSDPKVDLWFTMEFESFGSSKETYCEKYVEDGEIVLTFFGRVGEGYDATMIAAENYAKLFYANTDSTGKLVLTSKEPAVDFAGLNNPWYLVEISINYQYRG